MKSHRNVVVSVRLAGSGLAGSILTGPVLAGLVLAGLIGAAGCSMSTYYDMTPASAVPTATGDVAVKKKNDDTLELNVRVAKLPAPTTMADDRQRYVGWLKPADAADSVKLGVLDVDDDGNAKLEATTTHHDFAVFVTAEARADVDQPSSYLVMRRDITFTK